MPDNIAVFGAEFDPRKLEQGVNRANAKLNSLSTAAKGPIARLSKLKLAIGGVVTAMALRQVASYAVELFKLGAAANATASRFRTVFGESTAAIEDFNREFGKISGLSTQQFQDVSARLGAIAQGMGFAQRASSEFALELVKLSADLASFNDLPVEDVANRIAAALTGERESLKRLGVVITEVEVQQTALANTGKKTASSLTQQEKATATLQLITQKAGVAVGDLGRTSQEIDNVVKQLSAAWKDFNDKLGTFIAQSPLVRDLLAGTRDALRDITTILAGEREQIQQAFTLLGRVAGDAFVIALTKSLVTIPRVFAQPFLAILDKISRTGTLREAFEAGFAATDWATELGLTPLIDDIDVAINELGKLAGEVSNVEDAARKAGDAFNEAFRAGAFTLGIGPTGIPIVTPAGRGAGEIVRPAPPIGGLRTEGKFRTEEVQLQLDEDAWLEAQRAQEFLRDAYSATDEQIKLHINTIDSQTRIIDEMNQALASTGKAASQISQTEIDVRVRDFMAAGTSLLDAADYLRDVGIVGEDFDRVMRALAEALGEGQTAATDIKDVWQTGFRGMSMILSDFITGGIQGFEDLGDAILRMFQRLALEKAFETIGGALHLPGFQTGGTVPGPIGQPQLAVVHGGEQVVPVRDRRNENVTVSQNINFNISALDAPSVQQLLTQQKGTITAVVAEAINDSDTIRRLITRR